MRYDGYSDAHLARTWTDLLFVPYFLCGRAKAAMRIADARGIPRAGWPDAPRTDSPQIPTSASLLEESWPVALLVMADNGPQTPDLRVDFLGSKTRRFTLNVDECANLTAGTGRVHLCP